MFRKLGLALSLVTVAFVAACNNQPAGIAVTGGGFIFNYRLAVAYAGLIVVPHGTLPEKSRVEVTMENPAGGAPIVMNQSPIGGGKIEFTTDPLTGIVANKEYLVSVRLIAADGTELQRIDKKFHSELDQSVLPPAPLTIGPGYTPNPAATPDPDTSL
jgi:hypothetical protein